MLSIKKIILLTAISIIITACSTTSYKKTGWTNASKESDWDLDSAICLQKSQQLDDNDLQKIVAIKLEAQQNAASLNQMRFQQLNQDQQSGVTNVINAINTIRTMFATSREVAAEETIKEENFARCLENRSWSKS